MQKFSRSTRVVQFIILIIAAVILTAACARVPVTAPNTLQNVISAQQITRPPEALDPACLAGKWQVADLARNMNASVKRSGSLLRVDAVNGAALYNFAPDGRLEITYDRLEVRMSGAIDGEELVASNRLNGSAEAYYEIDSLQQEIVLSRFGGSGISFHLELNDQLLAEGDFPTWQAFTSSVNGEPDAGATDAQAPTHVVERARAAVRCSGNSLAIQTLDPYPGPRVELERIP